MSQKLDEILEVAPDATKAAAQTVIEQAVALMAVQPEVLPTGEFLPARPNPSPGMLLTPMAPIEDPHNKALQDDVDYAREQIKDLIDTGRIAIQGALELAESSDKSRDYEVVGGLITAVTTANKELITIHKIKKDAEKEVAAGGAAPAGTVNIDKAVFVGRASDLLRELNAVKKGMTDGTDS
jgi:hypothetical protein